jgi:hypothetical protein
VAGGQLVLHAAAQLAVHQLVEMETLGVGPQDGGVQLGPLHGLGQHAAGAAAQGLVHGGIGGVVAEAQGAGARVVPGDPVHGVVAIAVGHLQVHNGHVDVAHVGHLLLVGDAVLGLEHHLAVGPVQQQVHQSAADHLVVVHHSNAQGRCGHGRGGWGCGSRKYRRGGTVRHGEGEGPGFLPRLTKGC